MLAMAAERQPWLTEIMKLLSVAGSGAIEIPFALLLILGLWLRNRKPEASWYAAAVLSGWALYALTKFAVQRPRPHVISRLMHGAGWYSYPWATPCSRPWSSASASSPGRRRGQHQPCGELRSRSQR